MAPLEAMGHGLPVLLTRACNFPEVEAHGAGLVVGQSLEDLVGGLKRLTALPTSVLRMMGQQAKALVAEQFSLQSVGERLESVFLWMAGKRGVPAFVRLD
jgi:glycosyltransferase involved in cell wall biosynthesis